MTNSKIPALLIDDEAHNLEILGKLLEKHCPEISVCATASSATEARLQIGKHSPQLLFLDIEMPNENGFELLEKLQPYGFEVIFVNAYSQYTLRALRNCALDYLMKPIAVDELQNAVQKAKVTLLEKKENERLKALMDNLNDPHGPKKIALPTMEALRFVSTDQVIRCKGENNYTHFFLKDGTTVLVCKTLKEWEELLANQGFIRTHQSHLVNKQHVSTFVKKDGGYLIMNDGSTVSVSKYRKEQLIQKLME